eukprot:scaffold942_cov260-Pinguiococcus_pyrenoidosus.AAC.16
MTSERLLNLDIVILPGDCVILRRRNGATMLVQPSFQLPSYTKSRQPPLSPQANAAASSFLGGACSHGLAPPLWVPQASG